MIALQYPNLPLHEVMRATAYRHPHRTAICFDGRELSFAEFDAKSNRLANALHEIGVQPGDRVGIFLPNSPEWELSAYAVSKLGAVICPMNPSYRAFEITHILNDSGASMLLTHSKLWPFVEAVRPSLCSVRTYVIGGETVPKSPAVHGYREIQESQSTEPPRVQVDPDQLAILPYSSGTTGTPKGVMLTHRIVLANHLQFSTASQLGSDDTYLVYLPLSHIYGLALMGMAMMAGVQQIVMKRFDLDAVVRVIEQKRITWLHVVPPVLLTLADAPGLNAFQFRTVKYVMNAGAPLAPDVARRVEQRLGVRVVQAYGLTEASPCTHHTPLAAGRAINLESGGVPLPNTEQRIVDLETGQHPVAVGEVGEIVVRGPQVMQGYWNAPTETALALRNGWLYTGDIGWTDSDGNVFICDRKKEMIKYKAFSIAPAELEAVLFQHPDVADCGIVGVHDDEAGQVPKAFVVPRPGTVLNFERLSEFVVARVAGYKQIRQWQVVDNIPRTPTGKILRRNLKNLAATP